VIGPPEERPAHLRPRPLDDSFFGEPHRTVLRQVAAAIQGELDARARWEEKHRDGEVEAEREAVCWDVGAGEGAATAFLLSQLPTAAVYAVDMWHAGYYADSLREFGHEALADAYARRYAAPAAPAAAAAAAAAVASDAGAAGASSSGGGASIDPYLQFCVNFWEEERVTPVRYPDLVGVGQLAGSGIEPALVYVDADLHAPQLRAVLREAARRFPKAHLVGGGWDLSPEVRAAVMEVQRELGRPLHVEQGRCWTFSAEAVKVTGNSAEEASATLLAAAGSAAHRAETVESDAIRLEERKQAWLTGVLAAIGAGDDDVAALRAAVGTHGRKPRQGAAGGGAAGAAAGTGAGAAGCAAPAADEDEEAREVWIDVGDASKMHMTALMHAAKLGRQRQVEALIAEHGATVSLQAEKSLFSALGLAAFEGHLGVVRALLAAGANPLLMNRYGETPLANAMTRRRGAIVEILQPLTERASAAVKAMTPSSPPTPIPLRGGRTLTVRRVTGADQQLVQDLYSADMADIENRYSVVPRAGFWLATVSPADYQGLTGHAAAPGQRDAAGQVLIGCAGLKPWVAGQTTAASESKTGELLRVAVHPDVRRGGVATAMMRHIEAWAVRAGYTKLRLTTQTNLIAAQHLYARMGYANISPPGGVQKSYHGDLVCLIDFEKDLTAASAAAPAPAPAPAAGASAARTSGAAPAPAPSR
jgi:ribosomal protein S18 acetylase RimI-like enzyme